MEISIRKLPDSSRFLPQIGPAESFSLFSPHRTCRLYEAIGFTVRYSIVREVKHDETHSGSDCCGGAL